ncbi:HNH endonuclease signature motif containing protein [Mycoplasma zalophidermidis]|uniref:HNH endonuclease signature motif containing protein n=1 Tax=Mycoplasma zalophidermidis TaxID=398174 RepID=UPI00215C6CA8|nr:HNH endonuclease signature motif containing protein [Mycoplasma zalophidermidis]MCR8966247.1 HNH endonuclease [Mycoplasma zalophidermidis]
MKKYTSFILDKNEKILDFVGQISNEMYEYINEHNESKFILFYKYLTHSDLATFGKATHPNSHHKNLLYYITLEDMLKIEKSTNKPFQTAHQSCIGLKGDLYSLVGLPQPRNVLPYLINDYMNVFIVNENMQYFSSKYTKQIFDKLDKKISSRSKSWDFNSLDVNLTEGKFTPLNIHIAVHGLGMESDTDFHKIRHHLFKGDTVLLLFEIKKQEKNMFIFFEKNPIFFSIIGENNSAYAKYQERIRKKLINRITNKTNAIDDSKLQEDITRQEQTAWRKMLANEIMGYTQEDRQIFCPITYITADYDKLGSLFIASHIKGFSDPNTTSEEKYDINNGLLISANVDALFDKHLITINQEKKLVFSFLLKDNELLKSRLLLTSPIFEPILNEKRMKYLKYHESIFENKERERKKSLQ